MLMAAMQFTTTLFGLIYIPIKILEGDLAIVLHHTRLSQISEGLPLRKA